MNAKARRAKKPNPNLDTHGPRLLCGAGPCRHVVAWERRPGLIVLPIGMVKDAPGRYRWSNRAASRRTEAHREGWDRALYDQATWDRVGPLKFARTPCSLPCPDGHINDVDAVLDAG